MRAKIHRDAADLIRMETVVDPAPPTKGRYRAIIAVNDDVGDGMPIDLKSMSLDGYRRNPVVLFAHDRFSQLPVARTTSIGWTARGLEAEFEFLPNDTMASRVRNAWNKGFLRAASIGARPVRDGSGHELIEWSIVPVPADKDAVRALRGIMDTIFDDPEGTMTEEQIRQLVAELIASRGGDDAPGAGEIAKAVADALAQRSDDAEAVAQREAEIRSEVITVVIDELRSEHGIDFEATGERAGKGKPPWLKKKMGKKKADDDEEEMAKKAALAAEERAELLVLVRGLLPETFDTREATNREILVAAAGDEVKGAAERSADYLLAKVEEIVARRAAAAELNGVATPAPSGGTTPAQRGGVIDVTRHIKRA